MKNKILLGFLSLALVVGIAACDNGNADPVIIDGPPVIESLTINTGTTENTDFSATAVVNDGVTGSTISTLATATWSISSNGTVINSGTESLSGDAATINIAVSGGFAVGIYDIDLVVSDSNGNQSTETASFTVELPLPDFDISGDWTLEPVAGALKVGPAQGSNAWWQSGAGDVTGRDCLFDDVYTFTGNATGTFSVDVGDATWIEPWQGMDPEGCGAPVAPFVSSTDFTYTYQNNQLTLEGVGAAVGLVKAHNGVELGSPADAPAQVTYEIAAQSQEGNVRRMTLQIFAGGETWWEFLLISGTPDAVPIEVEGTWTLEPVAGALGVGPGQGDVSWWSSSSDDVSGRACLFDDTYTFNGGNFTMGMGSESWLEPWQGMDPEGCGSLVAPHDGMGTYTYELSGTDLKLIGQGAHMGLAKVTNGVELGAPGDAPADVTYIVSDYSDDGTNKRMTVQIFAGGETWWQFKLITQ
ncbi:hypothetical protein [Roseivirga sp.]|uniref:hypothetical protein n=1 Tax=Roseivirga sp. TaxID=1964215 RepID=UPI003B8B7888